MKLLVFTLSLLMFNSFSFAHNTTQPAAEGVVSDHTEPIRDVITIKDLSILINKKEKDIEQGKEFEINVNGNKVKVQAEGEEECHRHDSKGRTFILKDDKCNKKSEDFVEGAQCTKKVNDMKKCCNSKKILSCLTGQADDEEEAGMLSQITDFVSLSTGGIGGGALVLGSSAIKSKGMCSFLEVASKAYTVVNTLALGYCGKLIMDAKDACDLKLEMPDGLIEIRGEEGKRVKNDFKKKYGKTLLDETLEKCKDTYEDKLGNNYQNLDGECFNLEVAKIDNETNDSFEKSKKEVYWYVAKIGSGIYSAYKSNKCQKKIEEQNRRNKAQTLARQTKPLHCTSGLMVAYDNKCSDYCAAINHQDPICRNVPRVPGAVRNQYNNSYQSSFNRTRNNPFFSTNRFLKNEDKRNLSSVKKQKKTLFKENKKYTTNIFSKMTQTMNKKLKQNKIFKSSVSHQKHLSKKKNNYSYTNNKSSFLTKKDIFQTVSTAYSRICENNSCYRFDEK